MQEDEILITVHGFIVELCVYLCVYVCDISICMQKKKKKTVGA